VTRDLRERLAIPQDRLFRDEASSPSASVVVALRPGAGLSAARYGPSGTSWPAAWRGFRPSG